MPKSSRFQSLACVLLPTLTGCAPVVATYPMCPVPVLLSRVDRVRRSTPSEVAAGTPRQTLAAEAATYEGKHSTRTSEPEVLTVEVLEGPEPLRTQAAEVRLDGVGAGVFVAYLLFGAEDDAWITPRGEKVVVAK